MMVNRQAAITAAALNILMFFGALWVLPQLPEGTRVPIHYGVDGAPDGWASAPLGLFLFPVLSAAIWLLFAVGPLIDPRRENLRRSAQAYGVIWVGVTLFLAASHALTAAHVLGGKIDMARAIFMLVGVLLIVLGNVLGKVRPNFSMGIRTRWTLADVEIWDKTHRFGGWVFVAGGVALIMVTLTLAGHPAFALAFVGIIASIVILPILKSYLLWRNRGPS